VQNFSSLATKLREEFEVTAARLTYDVLNFLTAFDKIAYLVCICKCISPIPSAAGSSLCNPTTIEKIFRQKSVHFLINFIKFVINTRTETLLRINKFHSPDPWHQIGCGKQAKRILGIRKFVKTVNRKKCHKYSQEMP